ncbi:MAG: tetratricopeptide repeat protein [Methanothrix sp.]|nr:tetratricopeptide repeat protein [Methanothrix sp.]
MDQLVALQEIYASFSKGGDGLQKIDNKAIEGSCSELIGKLLDSSRKGRIDEEVCRELSLKLQDVYEIKRLGDICRRAGFPVLAISTYNRAVSFCSDPILRPVLQNNLGQAYAHQGDLAKAAFYYQKAADCFAVERDHAGLAHVLGNLGSAYRRSGDWDKAIEHYYRSLKTFEEMGDDLGIAQMTGSLGRVYSDMGEKELAARYFERSLNDFQRLGDKRSAAWVLDRLGRIAGQRKDWDKALGYFNSSLSLFEEQGESQSQGIVLSNLGRVYLQMDEATAAREPLERAVLLTSRQIKPNYQNALYCLAKTYSSLAKNCLQEAENDEGPGAKRDAGRISSQQQRQEATRLFSQAADRYQELASTLADGQAEIKAAAAIARGRSYLARLCEQVRGEEALLLMEKAISSLDDAAANAVDPKKAGILGLQRIVAGMKEARSIGFYANEPLMQSRALTNASEYLMGGAQGWASEEESGFLCQALKNINAGIELQRLGRDPTEKLQAAAEDLHHSEKHFGAAEILEGSAANVIGQCQAALLLIAGSMASYSLSKIDDNSILTWDESLHLLPITEKGEPVMIKINDLQTEPNAQSIERTDLPVLEVSRERCEAKDLLLADGSTDESEVFVSETANPEAGWLVPTKTAVACKSSGQLLLPVNRPPSENQLDENLPDESQLVHEKKDMPLKPEDTRQESSERAFPECSEETNEERSEKQPLEAGIEDTDPEFREAVLDHEIVKPIQESPFSHSKAIFLFKGLSVLLVMLLAIEAMIYLI